MASTEGERKFWEHYAGWKENPRSFYMSKDLLFVDWKSKKYRGKDRWNDKLSASQWHALKTTLLKKEKKQNTTTLRALRKRGLVDENGELTSYGRVLAIKQLPLAQQCSTLNIPLEQWHMPWHDNPEETVLKYLDESGVEAYYLENSFSYFIDYLLGKATILTAKKLGKMLFTLNLPYDFELFFWVKRDLDIYLDSIDIDHCISSFPICLPYLQPLLQIESPDQVLMRFDRIYRSLGLEKIKIIIQKYFENPLAYNFRGWPDLFIIDNSLPSFLEVKTSDRLHINQLITIPDLIQDNGIPVKVVRLNN